jgi:hypothetical protein
MFGLAFRKLLSEIIDLILEAADSSGDDGLVAALPWKSLVVIRRWVRDVIPQLLLVRLELIAQTFAWIAIIRISGC